MLMVHEHTMPILCNTTSADVLCDYVCVCVCDVSVCVASHLMYHSVCAMLQCLCCAL